MAALLIQFSVDLNETRCKSCGRGARFFCAYFQRAASKRELTPYDCRSRSSPAPGPHRPPPAALPPACWLHAARQAATCASCGPGASPSSPWPCPPPPSSPCPSPWASAWASSWSGGHHQRRFQNRLVGSGPGSGCPYGGRLYFGCGQSFFWLPTCLFRTHVSGVRSTERPCRCRRLYWMEKAGCCPRALGLNSARRPGATRT